MSDQTTQPSEIRIPSLNSGGENPPSFRMLGSSSSGNCGLVSTPTTRILVDAGFSGKRICALLAEVNLSISDIHAVFLSHEHQDHCAGFRGLCAYPHLSWIANRDTFRAIDHPRKDTCKWSFFETGSRFRFRDLTVDAFPIPHDASDPVGFVFSWGGEDLFGPLDSVAWLLDLGYVTELVKSKVRSARTLVIESNYDSHMLEQDTKRPWSVKQRIKGRHGHLSNQHVVDLLMDCKNAGWERIHIAHVSRDCNDIDHIRAAFSGLRQSLNGCLPPVSVFNPLTGKNESLW